ncbi:MAG: hypothetical protein JNJ83_06760 [Verrucomicrobiaceae bacterium]|nr:hypothetical protein [Verrucomicrobiaceae bacterium]
MKTTAHTVILTVALTTAAVSQQRPAGPQGSATPPAIMPRPQPSGGQTGGPVNNPQGQPKPPQGGTRPQQPHPTVGKPLVGGDPVEFDLPSERASFDGTGNNVAKPDQGAEGQVFGRKGVAAYSNGTDAPAGETRPSARAISNALAARPENARPNRRGATDYLWAWGQFLDHDLDETPTALPAEAFPVAVPAGDPQFDPTDTGTATIGLNRSSYEVVEGVRQQKNAITHYIDGSMIYGSTEARANALRALDGTGRMKTTDSAHGPLLPFNTDGLDNVPPGPNFFVAGDVRVNEQPTLLALHTLFVREHNYWANAYAAQNPDADDDEIFHFARKIVIAELQAITYREYLPVLLGRGAIPPYVGYNPNVDARVSNEFATAAYRFGHSTVSSTVLRLGADGLEAPEGNLTMLESFFNPALITESGIDSILRGLAGQACEELDQWIVDDLRNFLFGAPGSGGLDLAALNIQRGRDHGLPSFNQMRETLGLPTVRSFRDVNPNPAVIAELEAAYGTPDDMDLWIVGLAEKDRHGSMLGETLHRIISDQFRRTRDGDRFWYQHHLPRELVGMIHQQSLSRIIRRNTRIGEELPRNVWIIRKSTPGPQRPNQPGRPGQPPQTTTPQR